MIKKLVTALSISLISGCGVIYVPSDVHKMGENVRVIPLNFETVLAANRSQYSPKQLPAAFFESGGTSNIVAQSAPKTARPALSVPPKANPGPYRIGVGDVLVKQTTSPELTADIQVLPDQIVEYRVQQDGAITVPEVGRVNVAGMTPDEAEAALFQRLVESQTNPSIALEVKEFNSQSVSVDGAVQKPQVVPISTTPVYLSQVLSAAGVNAPDPDFAVIKIFRDGKPYQIPMNDYVTQASLQKIRLVDGDSVFVDQQYDIGNAASHADLAKMEYDINAGSREEARENFNKRFELDAVDRDYAYVAGEVLEPGRFALPFGKQATLADALYEQGGYNKETGNPSQIYVLRGSPDPADFGAVTAWHLNARNAANFVVATRMQLRPNDVVFVSEQPVTKWNRAIQQIVPSLITYGANVALTQ